MTMLPEVLLKCARKAYPQYEWFIRIGRPARLRLPKQSCIYFILSSTVDSPDDTPGRDCMALQIALEDHKNGGWTFWRGDDGTFLAESWNEAKVLQEKSKPELLYRIVEQSEWK